MDNDLRDLFIIFGTGAFVIIMLWLLFDNDSRRGPDDADATPLEM